mgnify:CR=1 FL=1
MKSATKLKLERGPALLGAADAAVLRERGAKFVADAHLNPFRGLRPYSEVAGCAAEFYHVNAYACCVEGRAQ